MNEYKDDELLMLSFFEYQLLHQLYYQLLNYLFQNGEHVVHLELLQHRQ